MHGFQNFIKLTLLLLVMTLTAGCTSYTMNSAVASWKDQPVSDVIVAWGQPSDEFKVSGKHLYMWNSYDGILLPPKSARSADLLYDKSCKRLLEVDRSGKVIFGAWEGGDCPWMFSGWGR